MLVEKVQRDGKMSKCSSIGKALLATLAICLPAFAVNHTDVTGLTRKIPLTKCCKELEVYLVGLDSCRPREKTYNGSKEIKAFTVGRSAANEHREVHDNEFNVTVNKFLCPRGHIAVSTFNYDFYIDGSMHSNTDKISFNPGQFCLHQSVPFGNYSARYCIQDHSRNTLRVLKCCPTGMALGKDGCQISDEPLIPIFSHYNGTPAYVDPNEGHYFVLHGVAPHCFGQHRVFLQHDDYYLLRDGQLYIKNSSKLQSNETGVETKEYCIDSTHLDGKTFNQVAIVCTATEPIHLSSTRTTTTNKPITEDDVPFSAENKRTRVFPYFLFVSAFFLVMTFLAYTLLPEMRNIHGVPVMCYVACLAVSYIVYGVLQLVNTNITELCRALAIIVHLLYLSTYAWLSVVCFDIWWTLRKMRPTRCINQAIRQPKLGKTIIFYSACAWLAPLAIVVTGQILDHLDMPEYIIKPMFNERSSCWFSSLKSVTAYVYAPVAVSVLLDIVFVIATGVLLHRAGFGLKDGTNKENTRYGYRLTVIIGLFVMKITGWITEFILALVGNLEGDLLYVVDSIELVASILTFVIFVCKSSVFEMLKKRYCTCLFGSLSSTARNSKDIILRDLSSTPGSRRRNNLVFTSSS